MEMIVTEDKEELKAAGAQLLPDGRCGVRIRGWEIETRHFPILNSANRSQWENKLETYHLPEMVFGDSCLVLKHSTTGVKIHFNAFDALKGWKKEALPAVEVPAAAKWKDRSKFSEEILMDYDYTFTTPYCGSQTIEKEVDGGEIPKEGNCEIYWEDCKEKIDVTAVASKEPILFYDEVVLYEDELSDSGTALLSVKLRVMPNSWFLLLRFWLRVDGALMRLRDTRMQCVFNQSTIPIVLRECSWREATFQSLSAKGYPSDPGSYCHPNDISQRLPVILHETQMLKFPGNL